MSMFSRSAAIVLALGLFSFSAAATPLQASNMRQEAWSPEIIELFERLPVQDGGRVKPLHTFAAFTLLRLHGTRSLKTVHEEKLTPVEWLLDTLFFPEAASDYELFIVQNAEVIEAIGLSMSGKKRRDRYSFTELRPGISRLFQLAREYGAIEDKNRTPVQRQLYLLANNVNYFMQLVSHMDYARARIPVGSSAELRAIFDGRSEIGFHEVVQHVEKLRELYSRLAVEHASEPGGELEDVANVLRTASELTSGTESLALIPPPDAASEAWMTPADVFMLAFENRSRTEEDVELLRGFEALALNRNNQEVFERELAGIVGQSEGRAQARADSQQIGLELTYYKLKLLDYSLYLFVLAFLTMAFMWLRPRGKILYATTSGSVLIATLLLIAAIVLRCVIRGRPPVSTLYETVLFVTAVGALVSLFIEAINRYRVAISAAAILGMVGLFIAGGYETLDKRDTMPSLVAVLDTNFWLATHVTSITIGYSAGMLAALLASVYLVAKVVGWKRDDRAFYKNLGRMVYGVLCFGLIFSVVGTILGGVWANDSWGRFWGWDPKENGALLIVLSQIVILHLRQGGYLREHGVCMAAAFGGTIVAFSWWGVNLLGVGLHSYGFTSGIHKSLWTYYWIQWGIVGLGGVAWMIERARLRAAGV